MRTPLSNEEVSAKLAELDYWRVDGKRLTRTFQFEDFKTAFGWMAMAALVAEEIGHHPDWKNVYRTVEVELSTHDAGGLTELDFKLADEMNRLAAPLLR